MRRDGTAKRGDVLIDERVSGVVGICFVVWKGRHVVGVVGG